MDDDDKVRRNLVVTSATVLFFFWLDISEGLIIRRILGEDAELTAWKVWASVLAVLIYQSHRYLHSFFGSEDWKNDKVVMALDTEYLASLLTMREAKSYLKSGKSVLAKGKVIFDTTYDPAKGGMQERKEFDGNIKDLRVEGSSPNGLWWHRRAHYKSESVIYSRPIEQQFELNGWKRLLIEVVSLILLLRTRFFTETAIPICIGYFAIWLATYSLAKTIR